MKDIISQNKYKIFNIYQLFGSPTFYNISMYASYYYYSKINKNYFNSFVEIYTEMIREQLRLNQLNKQKEQDTVPAPTTKNVTISVVYDTDRKYIYLVPSDYRNNNNFNPFKDKTIPILTDFSKLNLDDIKKAIKLDTRYIIDSIISININNYKSKIDPNNNNIPVTTNEIELVKKAILSNSNSLINICNKYLATYCAALNSNTDSYSFQSLLFIYIISLYNFIPVNNINLFQYLINKKNTKELYSDYQNEFNSLTTLPVPEIDMINIYSENNYNGNLTSKFIGNG
jgi:hypothetical protein